MGSTGRFARSPRLDEASPERRRSIVPALFALLSALVMASATISLIAMR